MTTVDEHARIMNVFLQAAELPAGPQREAFLDAVCGHADDVSIRREVEDLLAADAAESELDHPLVHPDLRDRLLDSTLSDDLASELQWDAERDVRRDHFAGGASGPDRSAAPAMPEEMPGSVHLRIEGLTVLEQVGAGGMGIVYRARQDQPRRDVAIKIIRDAFITASVRDRFVHEGHVLARLQHPGIAQIYGSGTELLSGRPYLVMEWIEGRPIDEWVRAQELSREDKIKLLMEVAAAVQYAHQRGVVHRDLKPANILVMPDGRPRILDFGVARVLSDDPWVVSPHTAPGQLVGTLPYMSPEQVSGDPAQIDTRSDVYALGVLLYQMLAGRLPHEVERTPIPEAVRQICEHTPPRLGTLNRELRGDLEIIVAKALARDKDDRYTSAAELAADLRRYLSGQVILARSPSTLDQLHKLVRRHRLVATMLGVFVFTLLAFIATIFMQSLHVREQRDLAVEALGEAQRHSARAEAVNAILNDALAAVSPRFAPRPDVTVRDFLDVTAASIAGRFADAPLDEAAARQTIGRMYLLLGRYADSEPHLTRAIELHRDHLDADDPLLADSLAELGRLRMHQRDDSEGRRLLQEALHILEKQDLEDSLAAATIMCDIAESHVRQDEQQQAADWLTRTLALCASAEQPAGEVTAKAHDLFGGLRRKQGRNEEAREHLERALEIRSRIRGNPVALARAKNSLGRLHMDRGELDRATTLFEESVDILRGVFGSHPVIASGLSDLGTAHRRAGRLADAERCQRSALEMYESLQPLDPEATATVMGNLAAVLAMKGGLAEAEDLFRRSLTLRLQVQAADHSEVLVSQMNLANVLARQSRFDEAEAVYAEVVPRLCARNGDRSVDCIAANYGWGQTLLQMQEPARALPLLEHVVRLAPEVMPSAHGLLGQSHERHAMCLQALNRPDEAVEAFRRSHASWVRAEGESGPNAQRVAESLACLLEAAGRTEEAAGWRAKGTAPDSALPEGATRPNG